MTFLSSLPHALFMQQGLSTWLMGTVWPLEIVKLTDSNSGSFLDLGELVLCMHSTVFNQRLKTGGELSKGSSSVWLIPGHPSPWPPCPLFSVPQLEEECWEFLSQCRGPDRGHVVTSEEFTWFAYLLSESSVTLVQCLKTFVSYTLSSFLVVHGRWAG